MKTSSSRRSLLAAVAVVAIGSVFGLATEAWAGYPDRPVTLIVPYQAGGSTETLARVFAKALGDQLGQPVIVKTRPGGGGAVGSTEIAASAPDGYTIMLSGSDPLTWTPLTLKVEYDVDSFTYVAQISEYQQAIVVRQDSPDTSFEDLLARSKQQAGLTYADQNAMSRAFLEYIAGKEGIEWTGIPTKGGGEMVPLLLAGKIDFAWSGGIHGRYGGQIRVLASMNAERLAASPDAPSIREKYDISMPGHMLIVGPRGLAGDVVARLNMAIEAAVKDPGYLDLLENKLLFPSKFVGSEALTEDMEATISSLRTVAQVAH
ncbi:MAG: tripartite tricarboxylate transporter substrate binding protein [Rhizobiaceae bacterium]|nr:tripartite tricarboxylate transporter substrate binding protein [Rhizobiaceae bacterium]